MKEEIKFACKKNLTRKNKLTFKPVEKFPKKCQIINKQIFI